MRIPLLLILLLLPTACLALPLWSVDKEQTVVDHDLLDSVIALNTTQFNITAEDEEFRVDVEKVSPPNLGVTSIFGRIDGHQESFFLLCRTDQGATIAFFRSATGDAYRLDHTMGSDHIYAVESEKLGSCGGGLKPSQVKLKEEPDHPLPARPSIKRDPSRSVADDGSRHDIIIGYTPAAESFMGGWDYIRAEAQLSVDAANLAYSNSNIASQLRLVHIAFTNYEEISAWSYIDHVLYLLDPNDGYMDDMPQDRDLTGADFVSVLIDGRDIMGDVETCGVARVMQSDEVNHDFEHLAYSVVSVQCATANWTLAHEVGHNRGCAHDRSHAQVDGAFDYSYGNYFAFDEVAGTGLRTIMSYDHFYFPHERVPYFSNPEVSFGGDATGVWPGLNEEAHNALTHDNTTAVCAAFRGERTFVQFSYPHAYSDGLVLFPYSTIAEGVAGSLVGGNIVIQESNPGYSGVLSEPRSFISDSAAGVVLGGSQ